jgi:spermidine dehydrogenase
MPSHYDLEPLAGGAEKYNLPNDHFDPMILEKRFPTGYFFKDHGWVKDPISMGFANTPWPLAVQKELDDFANNRRDVVSQHADPDRWLDSISYYELLDHLGYGPAVKRHIDPLLGVGNFGVCGNAVSAWAAKRLTVPGTIPSKEPNRFVDVSVVSFPGGNAAILRKMWARMLPAAIPGDGSLAAVAQGSIDFSALDRPGAPLRLRLSSTAVHIRHEGDPATAPSVRVTYVQNGKLHSVRAKAVVMGTGGWVNRNVVGDLPPSYASAYGQFRYGPVLTANVAVRHWRYFDRLGFAAARWFSGLGWHVCVRRNVAWRPDAPPLTPDSPIVLTLYIPLLHPEVDPAVQGMAGRAQLLSTSYTDFERQIREQLTDMFGNHGFDARRDIVGIVLNRWGHAYFAPGPGFFFGRADAPAPHEVIRKPHGRVVFAHSELQGNMNMAHAMLEGTRGARQAMEII